MTNPIWELSSHLPGSQRTRLLVLGVFVVLLASPYVVSHTVGAVDAGEYGIPIDGESHVTTAVPPGEYVIIPGLERMAAVQQSYRVKHTILATTQDGTRIELTYLSTHNVSQDDAARVWRHTHNERDELRVYFQSTCAWNAVNQRAGSYSNSSDVLAHQADIEAAVANCPDSGQNIQLASIRFERTDTQHLKQSSKPSNQAEVSLGRSPSRS